MVIRTIPAGWIAGLALLLLCSCQNTPLRPSNSDAPQLAEIAQLEWQRDADAEAFDRFFNHDSEGVRARAALALGRIQTEASRNLLLRHCTDEDGQEALRHIAFALGQIPHRDNWRMLRSLLSHESSSVRARAVEAIGKLGSKLPKEGEAVEGNKASSEGEILSGKAIAAAVTALSDSHLVVRGHAALALWRLSAASAIPQLVERLKASEPAPVRWRACYAIARMAHAEGLGVLRPFLDDPNPFVQTFAARGCGAPADVGALPHLAKLMKNSKAPLSARIEAVRACEKIAAVDVAARRRSVEALEGKPRPSEPPLLLATRIESLAKVLAAGTPLDQRQVDVAARWISALAHDAGASLSVRRAALPAWAQLQPGDALAAIETYATHANAWLRAAAVTALGQCVAGNDSATNVTILERLRDFDAALADDSLVSTERSLVRIALAESLLRLAAWPNAEGERTLSGVRAEAWHWLQGMLDDEDAAVRGTVVAGFASARHPQAISLLTEQFSKATGAQHWELRKSILETLHKDPQGKAAAKVLAQEALTDPFVVVQRAAQTILELPHGRAVAGETPRAPLLSREQVLDADPLEVVLHTTRGEVRLELYLDEAPLHVSNIIANARSGLYDGLPFHRVVPSFVIQGGDPWGNGWGDNGFHLPDETHLRPYLRGTLGMPKAGKDTGGCQIFITHTPTPHLDGRYTVFGRVTTGMEVVDTIEVGDLIERAEVNEHRFQAQHAQLTAAADAQ